MFKKLSMSAGIVLVFVLLLVPDRVTAVEPHQERVSYSVPLKENGVMSPFHEKQNKGWRQLNLQSRQAFSSYSLPAKLFKQVSVGDYYLLKSSVYRYEPVLYPYEYRPEHGSIPGVDLPALIEELSLVGVILLYILIKTSNGRKNRYKCCASNCCNHDLHHREIKRPPPIFIKF